MICLLLGFTARWVMTACNVLHSPGRSWKTYDGYCIIIMISLLLLWLILSLLLLLLLLLFLLSLILFWRCKDLFMK